MFYFIIDIGNFITAIIAIIPVIKYFINITINLARKYIIICRERFVCKKGKFVEKKKIERESRKDFKPTMYMNTSRIIKKNAKPAIKKGGDKKQND